MKIKTTPQLTEAIAALAAVQIEHEKRQSKLDAELARAQEKHAAALQELSNGAQVIFEEIKTYCTANRPELTNDGELKGLDLGTGKIGWRALPDKVEYPKNEEDTIIQRLLKNGFSALVETKTTHKINTKALLKTAPEQRPNIPNLEVVTGRESFYCDPTK